MTPERTRVVELLQSELLQRQQRNSAYSLRAFARDLKLAPATMSLILQGKRAVTEKKVLSWSQDAGFSCDYKQQLLQAVEQDLSVRIDPTLRRTRDLEEKMQYLQLRHDQFALISDWWHFGLLNLVKLKSTQHEPGWMAQRLGISVSDCEEALERLVRLKLMERIGEQWVRTARSIETASDLPSEAIRSYHRQNIRRALDAIESVDINKRDLSSIMVTTSPEKLEEAKRRIRLFRKELAVFLEEGEGVEVYSLNIQLFPQTREEP